MVTTNPVLSQRTTARAEPVNSGRRTGFFALLRRPSFKKALFLASDLMAVTIAHRLAETLALGWLRVTPGRLNPSDHRLFYMAFFVAVLYLFDAYKNPELRRPEKELELVFKGLSFFFVVLIFANFVLFKFQGASGFLLGAWYGMALVLVLIGRFSVRAFYNILWRRGLARQTALLAGPPDRLGAFLRELAIQRYQGYDLAGVLVAGESQRDLGDSGIDLAVLGTLVEWEQVAAQYGVQLMLLSLPPDAQVNYADVLDVVRQCQRKGIEVEVYSDLYGSPEFQFERNEFSGFLRFYAALRWSRAMQRAVKKVLDWSIGLIGSAVTLLITPFIALLVKLEDRGPVFYPREFVACNGEVRYYLKFRTMTQDADQILNSNPRLKQEFDKKYKLERDPRVLRVGRFLRKYSMDEFPQFFSLLTGQLSFVGPRVISREEVNRYGTSISRLLSVKPGMTGYWQVTGRQTTSYEERVQMDMFYIERWSIWLDLIIIARTFWRVLRADGAY